MPNYTEDEWAKIAGPNHEFVSIEQATRVRITECVSGVLGTFGRGLNDVLPDDKRQALKGLIPTLIGTSGDGKDEQRSFMALDWLIRTNTPAWLELAGLDGKAAALRALSPIVDMTTAGFAGPVVRAVQTKASAAWAAARVAARAAAEAATWDAAISGVDLAPTVVELQISAIALFGRMINPGDSK